jgi:hypothetical protein
MFRTIADYLLRCVVGCACGRFKVANCPTLPQEYLTKEYIDDDGCVLWILEIAD